MQEPNEKPDTQNQQRPKTDGKKSKSAANKSSGNGILLVNILLLIAIGVVLYSSQFYRESLLQTKEILTKKEEARSQEPIRAPREKKNVMCPQARADLESCLEKRERCKKTQKQFESAEQQFTKLISDCAKSNDENEKLNNNMETQIKQMEDNLLEAEKQL